MPQYLYSEIDPPFPHQIRCVPDNVEHEDGVQWLQSMYSTLELLDMEEGRDFITKSLTIFCFRTWELATRFDQAIYLGFANNILLTEQN